MGFDSKFGILFSAELAACHKNPDRMGALIESLSRALGFTIAMATGGKPEGIDLFMAGVEGYIHEEAVAKSRMAQFLNGGANANAG